MSKTILSRTWRYGLMMLGLIVFVIATGGCAPEDAVMDDQAEAGAERAAETERVEEEQPERSPCQLSCGTAAREKYRECLDAGGAKFDCGPEARGEMPACVEACEAESPEE